MRFEFGHVVLVPFPFTDQTSSKKRPAVIKPVFATIEQALVIRQLGVLDAADQKALRHAIARILA